jgi:hypothetical protein
LWTLLVIGILLIPSFCTSFLDLFHKPDDMLLRQHLAATARAAARHCVQAAFTFMCLPYEAFFSLDAVVRTTGGCCSLRKRLLNGVRRMIRIGIPVRMWERFGE